MLCTLHVVPVPKGLLGHTDRFKPDLFFVIKLYLKMYLYKGCQYNNKQPKLNENIIRKHYFLMDFANFQRFFKSYISIQFWLNTGNQTITGIIYRYRVEFLTSEETPSATQFFKRAAYKISHCRHPELLCLALPPHQKFGLILVIKIFKSF